MFWQSIRPSYSRRFHPSHRAKLSNDYIPLHSPTPSRKSPLRPKLLFPFTRRYSRLTITFALFSLALILFFFPFKSRPEPVQYFYQCRKCFQNPDLVLLPPPTNEQNNRRPPLFEAWNEYERSLSQHAEDDGTTKFIYMRNHVYGSGWGNVLQEMFLNTHLAYLSGRSFVFDNYTWDRTPSPYSSFNGKTIASRVPVSAMLAGPIIGGSFDPSLFEEDPLFPQAHSQHHPPFVSSEYYERVCAPDTRVVLDTEMIHESIGSWDGEANLKAFVDYLQSFPDRCVEFELDAEHVFNIWMFGSTRFLSLWPSLARSPILKQFTYSPLILGAFERNRHLFGLPPTDDDANSQQQTTIDTSDMLLSTSRLKKDLSNLSTTLLYPSTEFHLPLFPLEQLPSLYPHSPANPTIADTIPGLLVLHIRRGDFAQHCTKLVEWGSSFHAFNSFEDMRERDGFDASEASPAPGDEPVVPLPPEPESEFKSYFSGLLSWIGFTAPTTSNKQLAWKAYETNLTSYASAKKEYDARKERYGSAKAKYLERCYPDIDQIVKRVREVREAVLEESGPATPPLTHLYIMTNGKPPFLADLRLALQADAHTRSLPPWDSIQTSRDLIIGKEERYVAQTIDIYIAQRAEVFVGNGFSSLTANVVMLRKAHGFEGVKTRLW